MTTAKKGKKRRELAAEKARHRRAEIKLAVMAGYGGYCRCCGESRLAFLTIDHVDGSGSQHRSYMMRTGSYSGESFYRSLLQLGLPPGFQVLCRHCNSLKGKGSRCTCRDEPTVDELMMAVPVGFIDTMIEQSRRNARTPISEWDDYARETVEEAPARVLRRGRQRWTLLEKDEVLRQYFDGATVRQIAMSLDRPPRSIRQVIRNYDT